MGTEGGSSRGGVRPLRSTDDFARRGECVEIRESDSPGLGDEGDEPIDELSVTEVPLDRGDDEVSESLSEFRDDADDTDDTFLIFCAVARSDALSVWTLVVERSTGDEILKLEIDFAGLMSLVGMLPRSSYAVLRWTRDVVSALAIDMVIECVFRSFFGDVYG
jgi:hypothetical protein